jgi:hypothetical protein
MPFGGIQRVIIAFITYFPNKESLLMPCSNGSSMKYPLVETALEGTDNEDLSGGLRRLISALVDLLCGVLGCTEFSGTRYRSLVHRAMKTRCMLPVQC